MRIICTDAKRDFPLIALIEKNNSELLVTYTQSGTPYEWRESDCDLFFAPEKKEGWINLYDSYEGIVGRRVYESAKAARAEIDQNKLYITTIKIEWAE